MRNRLPGSITFLLEDSIFLMVGTLAGLIWANLHWAGYEQITSHLHFAINEIAMAFFFGIAAKEVYEALLPGGALASPRKAAMPLLATLGGMLGPASLYLAGVWLFDRPELLDGWAIPSATDIAFSYLAARFIFGAKHPAIPFLLLLAIADDGGGLLILALFYPTAEVNLLAFAGLVGGALGIALAFKRMKVANFWPYVAISGSLSWLGFYWGGLHPALALVPVIFAMPHEAVDGGIFAESEEVRRDALNQFKYWWRDPVELILGLFGFVNAGVVITGMGAGTWLVGLGLIVGKPLGIILFCLLGRALRLHLPDGMHWNDLIVLGCIAGIGFTVALFVSTVAFPPGPLLDAVKMGALFSFFSMGVAIV
ncbi:MAG: Na+/H+ antiporter NhaA, partial [Chloroflexota bacterium]|nr:Na+/H+ antiporter NhaA [Chloroflexota bacterium]